MKARMKQRVLFRAIPVLSLAVLFFSCGIEDYTILDPPSGTAVTNPDDARARYFSFLPAPVVDSDSPFQGTAVYYRIYANKSDLNADAASISYANTAYTDSGFRKMESLDYKSLKCERLDDIKSGILIPKDYTGRIYIRLYTESASDDTLSEGIRTGEPAKIIAMPRRYVNKQGFDLHRTDYDTNAINDDVPKPSDSDVKASTNASTDGWFVNAYAVSVGQNAETLAPMYSHLLHLGYIQIEKPR